ncbi:hypothetical protein ACLBXM_01725 [Xanthobacteraceae bacterium A53D]
MDSVIRIFAERGDLAHLALAAWAASISAVALALVRALIRAHQRLDDFVRELARFNARLGEE